MKWDLRIDVFTNQNQKKFKEIRTIEKNIEKKMRFSNTSQPISNLKLGFTYLQDLQIKNKNNS